MSDLLRRQSVGDNLLIDEGAVFRWRSRSSSSSVAPSVSARTTTWIDECPWQDDQQSSATFIESRRRPGPPIRR